MIDRPDGAPQLFSYSVQCGSRSPRSRPSVRPAVRPAVRPSILGCERAFKKRPTRRFQSRLDVHALARSRTANEPILNDADASFLSFHE